MKEQMPINNRTIEQSNNGGLTFKPSHPKLKREGTIFMAEPGKSEQLPKPKSTPPEVKKGLDKGRDAAKEALEALIGMLSPEERERLQRDREKFLAERPHKPKVKLPEGAVVGFREADVQAVIDPNFFEGQPKLQAIATRIQRLGEAEVGNIDHLSKALEDVTNLIGDLTVDQTLRRELENAITQLMVSERPIEERRRQEEAVWAGTLPPPPIFEGVSIPEPPTQEEIRGWREEALGTEQEKEETVRMKTRQRETLMRHFQTIQTGETERTINYQDAYSALDNAIRNREVDQAEAGELRRNLVTRAYLAQREMRETPESTRLIQEAEGIIRGTEGQPAERTQRLKEFINRRISPDEPIPAGVFRRIAQDAEASDMFLDKIISRPFDSPEAGYRLSFYAEINLAGFLIEVRNADPRRYNDYVSRSESTHRFHEMNRTILTESGNPDAFLSITRLIRPHHINTATSIRGVELARQLFEIAYGRLYAKTNRVTTDNFETDILEWVTEKFHEFAGYRFNRQTRRADYIDREIIKSEYLDESGNPRRLEDWEIRRAIAFGRNLTTSFYRQSEWIAWSSLPSEWEEWIKSMPSETVVRTFAGLKWLSRRFRIGRTGGGPLFVGKLYEKIQKSYKDAYEKGKIKLKKIGKLDIAEDLIPTWYFRGAGFDWGWRTIIAYFDIPTMRIQVPTRDVFDREVLQYEGRLANFVDRYAGQEVTFFDYFTRLEGVAAALATQKAPGFELPPEFKPSDSDKQNEMVARALSPVMDQVNLSLGALIQFGSTPRPIKEILWKKAANFLPLRISYFLAEEGVKTLTGYERVKGQGENLFSEEFETKLIKAQRLRIERQKENPRTPVQLWDTYRTAEDGSAIDFLQEAGLNEAEKNFVRELQQWFVRENKAGDLAQIRFPHLPFLDDVPFESADYIKTGDEVFPRRMGGDFRAFYETNGAFNAIIGNLSQKYDDMLGHFRKIVDQMSTPEDQKTGQDIVLPIVTTYFELARQWVWTRIPFIKTLRGLSGLPTSFMQVFFGRDAPSWDESTMNREAYKTVAAGILRREKLPGEKKAQISDILKDIGARWPNVLFDQARTIIPIIILIILFEIVKKVREREAT